MAEATPSDQLAATVMWYQNALTELVRFIELTGDKANEESQKAVQALGDEVIVEVMATPDVKEAMSNYSHSKSEEAMQGLVSSIKEVSKRVQNARWKAAFNEWLLIGFPYSVSIIDRMALVYGIMLLEEMVKEYLRFFLTFQPERLRARLDPQDKKEERTLTYSEVLTVTSNEDVVRMIIDKELDRLGHMNMDRMMSFFSRVLSVDVTEGFTTLQELKVAYYTRNLLVHNRGIMNDRVYKIIELCPINEYVTIDRELVVNMIAALTDLNARLHKVVRDKTGLSNKAYPNLGAKS